MKKETKKKILLSAILIIAIAALATVWFIFKPKGNNYDKKITVEVIYQDKTSDEYIIKTNAEFLRGAIEECKDLEVTGDESEYGLYIKKVNGVTADYNVDQSFWAVTINGEQSNYGIESLVIEDGGHYELVYTISEW